MEFSTPFRFDGFVAKSPFFTTENQLTEVSGSGGGVRGGAPPEPSLRPEPAAFMCPQRSGQSMDG